MIINDQTNSDLIFSPKVNGEVKGHGYDEEQANRALLLQPRRGLQDIFGDAPGQIKEYSENDWDALYDEQEALQSSLIHLRQRGNFGARIPSLDQNGQGYCWNYSVSMALMMLRASNNLPYVRISGHANACLIKNYRDEGGWGALGADFAMKYGSPSTEFWKEKSMSRSNDTPEMRANALQHRITEDWSDQSQSPYDRNLTRTQLATLLFCGIPVIGDFNWWGHSVCLLRWKRISRGNWGPEGLNSWTDGWGENGQFTLEGNKGRPDGAVALRVTGASNN